MQQLYSVSAVKGKKRRHVGTYRIKATAERVQLLVEDLVGKDWAAENIVASRAIGMYNERSPKKSNPSKKESHERSETAIISPFN